MTTTGASDDPMGEDAIDALAGEYVLGTLSASARRAVEQRLGSEPALRQAIASWEAKLHPLVETVEPMAPSPQLWARIEASISPAQVASHRAGAARWWDNLRLWRGLAGVGFAAAALMATVLAWRMQHELAPPQYVVVLVAPQDKSPGWMVQASAAQSELRLIPLGTMTIPSDKSLQFWTKADGWKGPVSLGLVTPGQALQVTMDRLPPLQPNQLFELTLEPSNGSPLDRPTGPIQFIGRAVKVL
jgi:anti-sigma-K factor RskA